MAARFSTCLHPLNLKASIFFAILSAPAAHVGTSTACVVVQIRSTQHEIPRGVTNLHAILHQPDMACLRMGAPFCKTMRYCLETDYHDTRRILQCTRASGRIGVGSMKLTWHKSFQFQKEDRLLFVRFSCAELRSSCRLRTCGALKTVTMISLLEFLDHFSIERRKIVGLAAGDQPSVSDDLPIYPRRARVTQI